MAANWIAARVVPQREAAIAERLTHEVGAVVYLPQVRSRSHRTARPPLIALFPTYLFVDLERSPPWQAVRRAPGVVSILMTGDAPSRCPEIEIAKLKASEIDGVVQIAGPPPPNGRKFKSGEKVRIRSGTLEGREGHYASQKRIGRVQVRVRLLGREVTVEFPVHAIAGV